MADDVDDIIDSWEDADAEELERRMDERKAVLVPKQTAVVKSAVNEAATGTDDVVPPMEFGKMDTRLPLKIQDSDRTEYVSPIKILKRPDKQGAEESEESLKNKEAVKVHKSLAEREADYASARERILGSDSIDSNSSKHTVQPSSKKIIKPRQEANQAPDDVIRHPKGPDGSRGFSSQSEQHTKQKGTKISKK